MPVHISTDKNETMKINWRPTHKTRKEKKLNQRKADKKITVFILKKKLLSASKTKAATVEF